MGAGTATLLNALLLLLHSILVGGASRDQPGMSGHWEYNTRLRQLGVEAVDRRTGGTDIAVQRVAYSVCSAVPCHALSCSVKRVRVLNVQCALVPSPVLKLGLLVSHSGDSVDVIEKRLCLLDVFSTQLEEALRENHIVNDGTQRSLVRLLVLVLLLDGMIAMAGALG